MLFNSFEFIFLFVPITFFIYFFLLEKNLSIIAKSFLVLSSLFFYGWWNILYLPIIIVSILFNYIIGNRLNQESENLHFSRKLLLAIGIVLNISLLGYFKYTDFFIENFNLISENNIELLHLSLPLAISFFTFQQISYLIDSYRKETKEYSFLNYALFVTFFPQLIAGPIVHHKEMMPQFFKNENNLKNYKNISMGLFIFSIGLFKKVIIADMFSKWATQGFDMATTLNLLEAWVTSLSYTFQLYFDFSGYTDMAIGIALFFNIKLPINFNSPYKAINIQDFWKRWHITLSKFLKDYIYIPLGGNRQGSFRTYNNLMITFIIGGLWHGAGWTFVFWGFLHGMALIIHRMWSHLNFRLWSWLGWFITFNFINITWVFFRAENWEDATKVLKNMFNLNNIILPEQLSEKLAFLNNYNIEFGAYLENIDGSTKTIPMIIIILFMILLSKNSIQKLQKFQLNYRTVLFTVITFFIGIISLDKVSEFLYFNF